MTNPVMIYQPEHETKYRIAWYGGESPMLHYEKKIGDEWVDMRVQTLGSGLPTQVKEMYQAMQEFYDDCITMEHEAMYGTIF